MKTKDKIEELERRIKELEARPPQIMSYPVYLPYPYYVWPAAPYIPSPIPFPQPFQPTWYTTTCGNEALSGATSITYGGAAPGIGLYSAN